MLVLCIKTCEFLHSVDIPIVNHSKEEIKMSLINLNKHLENINHKIAGLDKKFQL